MALAPAAAVDLWTLLTTYHPHLVRGKEPTDAFAIVEAHLGYLTEVSTKAPEYQAKLAIVSGDAKDIFQAELEWSTGSDEILRRYLLELKNILKGLDYYSQKYLYRHAEAMRSVKLLVELYPYEAAIFYEHNDEKRHAIVAYKESAQRGHKDAQYYLGLLYIFTPALIKTAELTTKDIAVIREEGKFWLDAAAKQGHVQAQEQLRKLIAEERGEMIAVPLPEVSEEEIAIEKEYQSNLADPSKSPVWQEYQGHLVAAAFMQATTVKEESSHPKVSALKKTTSSRTVPGFSSKLPAVTGTTQKLLVRNDSCGF